MKKDQEEMNIADNPLYHDTWKLRYDRLDGER